MLHTLSHRIFLRRQEVALLLITMVWGTAFLVIHIGLAHSGPLFFVGLRFAVAGAVCLLVFRGCMRHLTWLEVRGGCAIGVAIFLGYSLQTYGLTFITISQSAFITALYVPAVPLFQWLVMRSAPHPMAWIGVALALSGLLLLSGVDPLDTLVLGTGELLTLLGALAIAAEIVLIGKYAGRVDPRRVTVVQLVATSVLAFAAMPAANEEIPAFSWVGLAWGAAIGRLVGERLPPLALFGGMLVVLAVLVSEWRPGRRKAKVRAEHSSPPAHGQHPHSRRHQRQQDQTPRAQGGNRGHPCR
nr:DMT family transporter [Paracidovorax avenae]